jgi:hypothetical protein
LKALKLGALVAVGCNPHQPVITKEVADWAISLIQRDVENMATKFASGEVGQGDHQQESDLRRCIEHYPTLTDKEKVNFKVPQLLRAQPNLVPHVYIKRYCQMRSSFKNSQRGSAMAIQIAIADALKCGSIMQLPPEQALKELGVTSPVYYRGESW